MMFVYDDYDHHGKCKIEHFPKDDYSVVEVCYDDNAGLGALTYLPGFYDPGVAHFTNRSPFIGLSRFLSDGHLLPLIRHELGHAMGLEHSTDCQSLMGSADVGGCGGILPGQSWTGHDLHALYNKYAYHPID